MDNVNLNEKFSLYLEEYKGKHPNLKIIFDEKFKKGENTYDLKIDFISKELKNFNEDFLNNEIIKDIYLNQVFSFILKGLKGNIENEILVINDITYFGHNKQLRIKYYEVDLCVELELITFIPKNQ